jgi:hypothetical protein
MKLEKIIKSSTSKFGLILITPDNVDYAKKYPVVLFLHGSGGRGGGSTQSLDLLVNGECPKELQAAVDNKDFPFILLAVQTDGSYTQGETDFLYTFATQQITYTDIDQVHITGLSLGAGEVLRHITASAANAKRYASASAIATTWSGTNWANIVGAGLGIWLFHNLKDDNAGTPVAATNSAYDNIIALNPAIKPTRTIFNATGHGGWKEAYTEAPPVANNGIGLIYPAVSLYGWWKLCKRGASVEVPGQQASADMVANAGPDQTVTKQQITLDGSGSQKYTSASWGLVSAPAGVSVWDGAIFPKGSGWFKVDAFLPKIGAYTFRLTVRDAAGKAKTDDVVVNCNSLGDPTTPTTPTPAKKLLSVVYFADGSGLQVYDDKTTNPV